MEFLYWTYSSLPLRKQSMLLAYVRICKWHSLQDNSFAGMSARRIVILQTRGTAINFVNTQEYSEENLQSLMKHCFHTCYIDRGFNAALRAEEVEFPNFRFLFIRHFFYAFSFRIGRFRFGCSKKVGIRRCKVFRKEILPERIEAWRFLPKTEGPTLHLRKIPELPLHPKRKWLSDAMGRKRIPWRINREKRMNHR